MAETNIATSTALANKLFSAALFMENLRSCTMLSLLADKAMATQKQAVQKREKLQTSAGMPIVSVTDLTKQAGDRVSVDLQHDITGYPYMGSSMAEGKGESLSFDTDEFIINQSRKPIKPLNKMSQKRTKHNLRKLAMASLKRYFGKLSDQKIQIHLAGARGDENTRDWVIPLESNPEFSEVMINPVHPPSSGRYFVAGGGTQASDIGDTDALRLEDFDVITAKLREQETPIAPVEIMENSAYDLDMKWICFVTERQWHYILSRSGEGSVAWRNFLTGATKRLSISQHPLFSGECGVWNGMLIRRAARPIRFNAGSAVRTTSEEDSSTRSSTVAAGITVDRAIIVGAQALACVMGNATPEGAQYRDSFPSYWSEKWMDHGDKLEVLAGTMDGYGKLRFTNGAGQLNDYGVAVIDSYAPDPSSTAGNLLRTALSS